MITLVDRWRDVVVPLCPPELAPRAVGLGEDLLQRWLEPHRSYHDVVHLAEVLAALDELGEGGALPDDSGAVADLVAWFHDAIYDVYAPPGETEEASARLAEETLPTIGLPSDVIAAVARVVRESATHEPSGTGPDPMGDAFHDADLWILASETERFDAYCHQVRLEYRQVPAEDFARGRSEVLAPFARRERLYRTDHAHEHWTARARANLARELDRLTVAPPA